MEEILRGIDAGHTQVEEEKQGQALLNANKTNGLGRLAYIETYGCQMNFNDSEIVASVLADSGFTFTQNPFESSLILVNTCSIREKAEETVRKRLTEFNKYKKANPGTLIGVMGCMAERLKHKLLEEEKIVDLVVGPDSYRDLPLLVQEADTGQKAVNVFLSRDETYADINPVRLQSNGISAFISITRGCDNMCSFCVVPFTRGRERSRAPKSILAEAQDLYDRGFKEVTLLGQNVDSYKWDEENEKVSFADLLVLVAGVGSDLRVRFSTSHPKDMTDEVLYAMKAHENICDYVHLPVQSGNSRVLELMNRTYDREWYINRIDAIKRIIPECGISTDIITGFCTETEEEHQDTLSMMDYVVYDYTYSFFYSERPGTLAARKFEDDIPLAIKKRRLAEVVAKQREHSFLSNQKDLGKTYKVLVEGESKKSAEDFCGRNSQNKMIVFPKGDYVKGDYVMVKVNDCTSATLIGEYVGKV